MQLNPLSFREGAYILIDKPGGWTSFDVIAKLRGPLQRFAQEPKLKLGHTGTLDPMATGLLVIATGKFTKTIAALQDLDKEYTGVIRLGGITASYDAETPVISEYDYSSITEHQLSNVVQHFKGEISQIPPSYSSIKVGGVRSYKKAREGETVELSPRKISIYSFELLQIDFPLIGFRISCSKGTYIRSIAHDIGQALGCGAYLVELRRTRVGDFKIEDASSIEDFLRSIKV